MVSLQRRLIVVSCHAIQTWITSTQKVHVMPKKFILDASGLPSSGKIPPMLALDHIVEQMPQATYIRQAGLLPGVLPISPATLWRWVKIGAFPKPHKLSPRVTAWAILDVRNWLVSKQNHDNVAT